MLWVWWGVGVGVFAVGYCMLLHRFAFFDICCALIWIKHQSHQRPFRSPVSDTSCLSLFQMILIYFDHPHDSYPTASDSMISFMAEPSTRWAEVRGGQAPDPQCEPICFGSLASILKGCPVWSVCPPVFDERLLLNDEIQVIFIPTNVSNTFPIITLLRFVKGCGNGRQLCPAGHVFTCLFIKCSRVEMCWIWIHIAPSL